jgi:membrane protein
MVGMARSSSIGRMTSVSWWVDRVQLMLPGPAARIVQRARRDDILLLSAGLAYYALLSIVPLVIVSLWISALVVGDQRIESFAHRLGQIGPKDVGIEEAIRAVADRGTRLGLLSALGGIWPATAYGSGLAQALRRITPHPDRRRIAVLGRGFLLVSVLPLLVLGSITASYAGTRVLSDAQGGQVLGLGAALLAAFVMAALVITLIYAVLPSEKLQWQAIFKATAFSAMGVSVLSVLLILYVTTLANFEERYATSGAAAVVFLGVWLFLSNVLLLIGYKIALEADPTTREQALNL